MSKDKLPLINPAFVLLLFFLFTLYTGVATMTFAFRHPWATQTEILLNIHKVLTFQKVSYKETEAKYE